MTSGVPLSLDRRQEILDAVQAGISRGTPLTVVLESIGCPMQTFQNWRDASEEVREAVLAARDLGWDWLAWDCIRLASERDGDIIYDADGNPHPNSASVLARKLEIDTKLKLLAKWDPRRYGESKRVEVEANVRVTQRHVVDSRALSDEGRAALRRLLAEAQAKGLLPAPDGVDHAVMDAAEVLDGEYHEVIDDGEAEGDDTDN